METFVGDIVRIYLYTGITLTGYTTGIKFKRPDGTVGFWFSTIDPLDATSMYYDTDLDDLNIEGQWQLQAFAEDAGVRGHGRIVELTVSKPLSEREVETTVAPTTVVPTTFPA